MQRYVLSEIWQKIISELREFFSEISYWKSRAYLTPEGKRQCDSQEINRPSNIRGLHQQAPRYGGLSVSF